MKLEHTEFARGALIERPQIVELILDGASKTQARGKRGWATASPDLNTAPIIWCDESDEDFRLLDRAAAHWAMLSDAHGPLR